MSRTRTDLDYDGAGRPEYNAATEDYITEHATRLGITHDAAAILYERARTHAFVLPLHEIEAADHETPSED